MLLRVAAGFAPWRVRPHRVHPHSDSTGNQVLKIHLSLTEKKDNIVCMMKQNYTKHVYSLSLNPLKMAGELEIESLEGVHGCKLGRSECAMGQN